MTTLEELVVKIKADTSGLDADLKDVTASLKSFGKAAGAGIAAVGTAVATASAKFIGGAKDVASYGDNIDKMSQKMNMTAEAYQEWDFIMQHCGTSMDSMKASMKTLSTAAEKGNDAFAQLGISQEQIASLDQQGLFDATIAALQQVEDDTQRTYLAGQLLGRGATELGAVLNMSAEETAEMKQQVHDLGGVLSDESVKASAQFQDSLQNMNVAMDGITNNLMAKFLPSMSTAMDGLAALFSGDTENGLELISKGVQDFINEITTELPKFAEVGLSIVESLAQGIIDNIPSLLKCATDIVLQLTTDIISELPKLFEIGLEAITTLADGLGDALPELIPAAIDCIIQICTGLVENVDKIIEAAGKLIIGLAEGLIKAIPTLVKAVPKIIQSIAKGFTGAVKEYINIGTNIVKGIFNGISNATTWLYNKVKGWVDGVVSKIKGFFGIHSPSTVFAGIGAYLIEGLGQGIENNKDTAINAMRGVTRGVEGAFNPKLKSKGLSTNYNSALYAPSGEATSTLVNDLFNKLNSNTNNTPIILKVDGKTFAQTSIRTINQLTRQTGSLGLNIS